MIRYNYNGLTGEIVTRDDFSYEENRKGWNRAIENYPLVIVYCYSKNDVINAMNWTYLNEVDIRIRSGGHHYEGYSNGNEVIVIDVSKMNLIYLDSKNSVVKIEGGVNNRQLNEVLGKEGYLFAGGGCPTVGICGLTLGGGWGYSARLLGLTCDNLREVEIINYKGEAIICNDKLNTDLFWACRGGGGENFGIITSMTFNLPLKIKMATLIDIDYNDVKIEDKIKLFEELQKKFKNLDRRINVKFTIYNSENKGKGIRITGLFYGSAEECENILESFKNIAKSNAFSLKYITVMEANKRIQDSHPEYEKYKSTGRFVYKDFNRSEIENIINLIDVRPKGSIYSAITLYGLGGAIEEKGKSETAFYYRDAKFIVGIQSVWEVSKFALLNQKWVIEKFEYITTITSGSYINFPFRELSDFESEYYGENIYDLKIIKRKYDPNNVFNFPQAIIGENIKSLY